jgi:hypothetical protein
MRRTLFASIVLASLWLAGSAAALCTCGDRDGCGSAAACAGKIPGDECGNNRSCKIVVGTGNDLTCCCGCSKGVGPKACNYAALGVIEIPSAAGCDSEKLTKLATKTHGAVNTLLHEADDACEAEKNALKKATAARGKLARLRKKIEKARDKGKVDAACAANAIALLDTIGPRIDDFEAGSPGGPGSTTTTTIPGTGPSCSATFAFFPSDAAEVDFVLGCFAAGADYTGFRLTMHGGRQVTNYLQPPGFNCTINTNHATNDSLACAGVFNIDVPVTGGRIRTDPAPVADLDASLEVLVGVSTVYGPFPTTGP